jgi:hypothetical protein
MVEEDGGDGGMAVEEVEEFSSAVTGMSDDAD